MSTPLPQDLDGVRKQPTPRTALIVFIGYLAVIVGVNLITARDFDFGDVAANASNTRNGIVLPILAASIYLTIVTTVLGWWRPALYESKRQKRVPSWLWIIPVLAFVPCIANIVRSDHRGEFTSAHWVWIIIGFALVGYSEELMTRGLLVTGFRSTMRESRVMLYSSVLFGVMHGLNIVFGQAVGTSITQMIGTIPMGILFYYLRRITGSLFVPMVVHALWDISLVTFTGTSVALNELDTESVRPANLIGVILLCAIAGAVHRKRLFRAG